MGKGWLENQRKAGEKCLEIKVRDSCHYVYRSTTRYDRKLKKSRKVSEYLGKLDREHGFIPKGETPTTEVPAVSQSITDYGNSMILHNLMAKLKPLLRDNFPEQWRELYAMSIVRVNGYVLLRRVKDSWEELYDPEGLNQNLSPANLSKVLGEVGLNRSGQDAVLSCLSPLIQNFQK